METMSGPDQLKNLRIITWKTLTSEMIIILRYKWSKNSKKIELVEFNTSVNQHLSVLIDTLSPFQIQTSSSLFWSFVCCSTDTTLIKIDGKIKKKVQI